MVKTDDILDEILNHGPSADSISIVLTRMKKEGRLSEVVQGCIKFLRVYPDNMRLRLLLAESCLEIGSIGPAESELEKVTAMIEDLTHSYRLLAGIYAKQRRVAEAADTLKLYLAHCPGEPEALKLLEEVESAEGTQLEVGRPTDDAVVAVDENAAVVDIATPTIAELYYAQGNLSAAIAIYEKVVNDKPDDGDSLKRLIELKGMVSEEPGPEKRVRDEQRARTETMITILERWLPKIKEMQHV